MVTAKLSRVAHIHDTMRLAPKFFSILYHISCLETHGGGCLDVACDGPNDIYKFWCIHSTSALSLRDWGAPAEASQEAWLAVVAALRLVPSSETR